MKMKQIIGITVMATSLLTGGIALAQAGDGKICDRDGRQTVHENHKQGKQSMRRLMSRLDMDQAQREQMQAIVAANRDAMQAQRQAMQEIRQQLHQAASSEAYDAAQIKQLAEQKARLVAEMTLQRTEMMHKIYQQMSPEQQEKFNAMRNKHRHHNS